MEKVVYDHVITGCMKIPLLNNAEIRLHWQLESWHCLTFECLTCNCNNVLFNMILCNINTIPLWYGMLNLNDKPWTFWKGRRGQFLSLKPQYSPASWGKQILQTYIVSWSTLPVGIGSLEVSPDAFSSASFSQRATVLPFHSCSGNNSTATTSPWIARFRALVP